MKHRPGETETVTKAELLHTFLFIPFSSCYNDNVRSLAVMNPLSSTEYVSSQHDVEIKQWLKKGIKSQSTLESDKESLISLSIISFSIL